MRQQLQGLMLARFVSESNKSLMFYMCFICLYNSGLLELRYIFVVLTNIANPTGFYHSGMI